MPKRSFNDSYWGDPFVQDLEKDAKLLFVYLWTNKRCNSAGLYEITLKTISFETGIDIDLLPTLLDQLSQKVKWEWASNIIWVRNFLKHQPKSPQFLKSVADSLSSISSNDIVKEMLDYYSSIGVLIPYRYPIDTVSKGYGYILEPELEQEYIKNNKGGSRGDKKPYGHFNNVMLTDVEKRKLVDRFGEQGFKDRVENLSEAIESKGYKYKSHYAVILNWERKNNERDTERRRNNQRVEANEPADSEELSQEEWERESGDD
jgi:hypothetical protein